MDFYVNLRETTLKTQYCREHKSVKIFLKTGLGRKQKLLIEVFGIPRDCKDNLLLTDYEITTMDDHYIALKPYFSFSDARSDRLVMIILPTSPLNEKPYVDPIMNRYQYYIRRSRVNAYFCMIHHHKEDIVYEKEVHIYDISFDTLAVKNEFFGGMNKRVINGKEKFLSDYHRSSPADYKE
ncbi:MAG: hypothetical protein IKI57_00215 [Clostridia bacterium]|nr:hypothetical protein [Clostridia bacterium]